MKRLIVPHSKTFIFRGAVMNYTVIGGGKPVILVHGSMSHDPWCDMEFELAKYFQLYLPDLPGFGASEEVKGPVHDTDLFSDALDEFVNHTKLSHAPVIGFSLGGVTAIKSASKGNLNGKLVLIGVPGKVKNKKLRIASLLPIRLRHNLALSSLARKKILIPIFKDVIGIKDKERDHILYDAMLSTSVKSLTDINMFERKDRNVLSLLKRVKNETVFIYGEYDKLLTSTKNFVVDPTIIKGADHVVFSSQPQKTLSTLRDILGE